jgi:diguanylate cyclase (GGDEF)-like protein/PAS domain S-box-containing protein
MTRSCYVDHVEGIPRVDSKGTGRPQSSPGPCIAAHLPAVAVVEDPTTSGAAGAHQDALQKGLRLYQTIFERGSFSQLVVDFPSFRIDVVNSAFCTMTGYSAEELVGHDAAMVFPADKNPTADIVARTADRNTDGYSVERLFQRRDGSILPILSTVSVVRDDDGRPVQLLVLSQDLTGKQVAEEAQRRSQALVAAAIATLPVTFTTLDRDLRFTSVAGGLDPRASGPTEVLGKHISELTDDPATFRALRNALAGSRSTTRTIVGDEAYLTLNAPMYDDDGAVGGVVSVSTNITTEVSAQAERLRAEELKLFVATHDPLTGLPGRSGLIEHLSNLSSTGRGAGALLLLDLDDFHLINDSLGHEMGDAVLMEVASRVSDAFPGLMVARHGGDQFAVVAPFAVDRAEAVEAAERVRAALDADVEFGDNSLQITASVGLALEETRGSSSTLIRDADSALAQAKDAGSGQYRVYDAKMRHEVQDRLMIRNGLRAALSAGQLRIAYQPIVDLADRRIVGSEALLRWTHPERGAISPEEFIPIAEQSGLIVPVGQWVMNTACDDVLSLQRDHGTYISVNVSVRQLVGGGFADWVEEVLERTGLPPCALTVEVTESALLDNVGVIRTAFDRLRSWGVRVAIDDFGTGYSSLARLQHLPVDVIKLDRAFVTQLNVRAEARGMASAILQLSAAIGASTVAEGVETEAEAATLIDLGYTIGQGFLFARPMPIEDLTAHLCVGSTRPPGTPGTLGQVA